MTGSQCGHSCGAHLVCDVVPCVGEEAGQGELVQPGRVSPELHLAQLGHESVEAGGRGSRVWALPPHLQHHGHAHHTTRLLLGLNRNIKLTLVRCGNIAAPIINTQVDLMLLLFLATFGSILMAKMALKMDE